MEKLSHQQLQNQVNIFNMAFSPGDRVEVLKNSEGTETFEDEITHAATIMGGHTAMIWLSEKGSYDLSFVIGKASQEREDIDQILETILSKFLTHYELHRSIYTRGAWTNQSIASVAIKNGCITRDASRLKAFISEIPKLEKS